MMKRIPLILLLVFLSASFLSARGEIYFYKGITYILIDDTAMATDNLNRYFNMNPDPALKGGFLKLINKEYDAAMDLFQTFLNRNIRSTHGLVGIALSTAHMEVSNTMELLERAIRLNRGYSPAYLCLGVEFMKKKNFPQAESNIRRAINLTNLNEYKIILARLYLLLDNPQAVISLLKSVADTDPENFYYSYLIAQAYYRLNDLRRCGKYIEAAIEVNPINSDAKLLMAKYLVGIDELKRARSILKELSFAAYNKDYVKTYAQVLLKLKDRTVEDYLYEFFASDKWDKDINRLMGGYYLWQSPRASLAVVSLVATPR